jgi:hypothetical protein
MLGSIISLQALALTLGEDIMRAAAVVTDAAAETELQGFNLTRPARPTSFLHQSNASGIGRWPIQVKST